MGITGILDNAKPKSPRLSGVASAVLQMNHLKRDEQRAGVLMTGCVSIDYSELAIHN